VRNTVCVVFINCDAPIGLDLDVKLLLACDKNARILRKSCRKHHLGVQRMRRQTQLTRT